MNDRRFAEARDLLAPLGRDWPEQPDVQHLLGASCLATGDPVAAESAFLSALRADPAHQRAAVDVARLLSGQDRPAELLDLTDRAASIERPHEILLGERSRALVVLGRGDEAIAVRHRAVGLNPGKAAPVHNLAAAQGDLGLNGEAEASARAALQLADRPETWLILARALQGQNRFDEAEQAFTEATFRRPLNLAALGDHAQLVWMRTGSLDAAAAVLDRQGAQGEARQPIRLLRARLMQSAGDAVGAYALLQPDIEAGSPAALGLAAQLALELNPEAALTHARHALTSTPQDLATQRTLVAALLAVGNAHAALDALVEPLRRRPLDQGFIAAQWIAWRLLGDVRATALYDYATTVSVGMIDTPPGWTTLRSYLDDLAVALRALHGFTAHPIGQSLRNGAQTSINLLRSDEPAIRAFPHAIDAVIRRHLAFIGSGDDVLRSRNSGGYRIQSMWSVRLAPGGFHTDHVHPEGWLSSACYIETPDEQDVEDKAGWLKFGEPGGPTRPALAAEHYVKPQPGLLALFPSYMWHGTTPFTQGRRMTIAFDLVPA